MEAHAGTVRSGDCVRIFSYWDLAALRAADQLLNSRTGELIPATLSGEGPDTIEVRGAQYRADRYRLVAEDLEIVLWYTPEGEWLQLDSITSDGKRLRYRLQ
jgi:hypothetical protein